MESNFNNDSREVKFQLQIISLIKLRQLIL